MKIDPKGVGDERYESYVRYCVMIGAKPSSYTNWQRNSAKGHDRK